MIFENLNFRDLLFIGSILIILSNHSMHSNTHLLSFLHSLITHNYSSIYDSTNFMIIFMINFNIVRIIIII